MTPMGRMVIALIVIAGSVAIGITQTLVEGDGAGAFTFVGPVFGLVLGYVFGDRNGEKRLASALTELQADELRTQRDEREGNHRGGAGGAGGPGGQGAGGPGGLGGPGGPGGT